MTLVIFILGVDGLGWTGIHGRAFCAAQVGELDYASSTVDVTALPPHSRARIILVSHRWWSSPKAMPDQAGWPKARFMVDIFVPQFCADVGCGNAPGPTSEPHTTLNSKHLKPPIPAQQSFDALVLCLVYMTTVCCFEHPPPPHYRGSLKSVPPGMHGCLACSEPAGQWLKYRGIPQATQVSGMVSGVSTGTSSGNSVLRSFPEGILMNKNVLKDSAKNILPSDSKGPSKISAIGVPSSRWWGAEIGFCSHWIGWSHCKSLS